MYIMVYSKKTKNAVNDAILNLQMVNQTRENTKNLALVKHAYSKILEAIEELEE